MLKNLSGNFKKPQNLALGCGTVIKTIPFIVLIVLLFAFNAEAAKQIAYISFNGSKNDAYGYANVDKGSYSFVSTGCQSGQCLRSSWSPGDSDLRVLTPIPSTNELYIEVYMRIDPNYAASGGEDGWKLHWIRATVGGKTATWEVNTSEIEGRNFNVHAYSDGISGFVGTNNKAVWGNSWGGSLKSSTMRFFQIYWKRSSGTNNLNSDGRYWLRINGNTIHDMRNIKTGPIPHVNFPSINGQWVPSGNAYWYMDEYKAWDGIPSSSNSTNTSTGSTSSTSSTTSNSNNAKPLPPGVPGEDK